MENGTEVLKSDDPRAVVNLVENVVDLHLGGVGAGPPHGREEGVGGDLPVAGPVKAGEGRPAGHMLTSH